MHKKLGAPTKKRLKRKSLNHLTTELCGKETKSLTKKLVHSHHSIKNWNLTSETYTIELEVTGLSSRLEQNLAPEKSNILEMFNDKYPSIIWTHIHIDKTTHALKNGGSVYQNH